MSAGTNTVDEVQAGRRLPFSRPFARAGFSRAEAEAWRRAGWADPTEASAWHDLGGDCSPVQLRSLCHERFEPAQIARVASVAPVHTAAWTRALSPERPDPDLEIDLREIPRRARRATPSSDDALRAAVRQNLNRTTTDPARAVPRQRS